MLVEAISVVQDVEDEVMKGTIRGVEMLRHLPLHVCQFDLEGKVVFQNPAAIVIEEVDVEDGTETNGFEDSCSSDVLTDSSSSSLPMDMIVPGVVEAETLSIALWIETWAEECSRSCRRRTMIPQIYEHKSIPIMVQDGAPYNYTRQ